MKVTYKQELTNGKVTNKEIINILLKNRGVTDVKDFLSPPSPLSYSLKSFGFNKEIPKVMKLLKKVRDEGKTVVVYTDYDADGITGGAILWETLFLLGFKVMPYVPHRKLEGYGFSIKGIDAVKEKYDPGLIISVDHGIAAVEQIAYARSIGIPVIVTDHHQKQERLPEAAESIFHIPVLSGSGVAYYFAKEVFEYFGSSESEMTSNLRQLELNFKTDYLALASIGSIADLVPLVGATRSLVKEGLRVFPMVKRYGIRHICREAGIEGRVVTPYEIGFVIAPRINAVGRLEHAIDALRLLCTTNEGRAAELASSVGVTNTSRQDLVKQAVVEALEQVETLKVDGVLPKIIIIHSANWHEGIIGLIASNILEKYYRPVIVMTESDGQMKGSARSISAFHITNFFGSIKDSFISYGGHKAAAGFTLSRDTLESFKKMVVEKVETMLSDSDLERVIDVDLKIPVSSVNLYLAKDLEILNPFGIGNPQPTFVSDVAVSDAQLFGKTNDHLKLFVKNNTEPNSHSLEIIAFGKASLFNSLSRDQEVQLIYQLDINRWNGKESLRGKFVEYLPLKND